MVSSQEVVIVGAGPAGAVLAILLARSGVEVTLVERQTVLDREFRGPAYQPSVVRLWNEMGILEDVLEIEHKKFDSFSFQQKGKKIFEAKFGDLPAPYNYVLVLRQAPLLRKLIEIAGQYPNFTYMGGTDAEGLIFEEGRVVGIESSAGPMRAKLIVAADGRFSKLRAAAGIELDERPQGFDVLWFEMPKPEGVDFDVGFQVTEQGLMVSIPKEEGLLQLGWLLAKGNYAAFKAMGLDHFQRQLGEIHPDFAKHLTSWDQCSLLDVKMGVAREWSRDGLLLIGDAAHIASPVGALGNKLAVEDAAIVHPLIVDYLRKGERDLSRFEKGRRRDIERNLYIQRVIGKLAIEVRSPAVQITRRLIAPLMKPVFNRFRKEIALSPTPIHIDDRPFVEPGRRYHLLRVAEVIEETPLAKSIRLEVPAHLRHLYTYWAGQFITVRLLRQGRLLKRCYSLSSCPVENDLLQITVKKMEDGVVSTHLHENVRPGDQLVILPPAGLFMMPDAGVYHYLFITGGSGITPCRSLIRTIRKESPQSRISIFYVNHDPSEVIFRKEVDEFDVTHWFTSERGRPTIDDLRKFLVTANEKLSPQVYLCGPPGLTALARKAITLPAWHIHEERYLSAVSLEEGVLVTQELVVGEGTPGVPSSISVQVDDELQTIPYREGQTILDAALQAGMPAPFSCQEGICATCRARLTEGQVVMDKHEALSKKEAEEGLVLTCRAKPLTQCCSVRFQ